MKIRMPDKYYQAAIILLLGSSIFIALPLIIRIGDATAAALVLAGMGFVMAGSFLIILSGGEPMDPGIVSLLPAQGSITLCRISSELGIHGKAHLLPPQYTDAPGVMQLNPASEYNGTSLVTEKSALETAPRGFLTIPSGDPLVTVLKRRNAMVIPHLPDELDTLLKETIVDTLDLASRVSVSWCDGQISVILYEYQLIEGCRILAENSPQCCSRYPCPICSLCGGLIAEGINEVIIVEGCSFEPSAEDVTIIFRKLAAEQIHGDTDSGNSH